MWTPPATAAITSGKDNFADLINTKRIDDQMDYGRKTDDLEIKICRFVRELYLGREGTQYGIKFFNAQ